MRPILTATRSAPSTVAVSSTASSPGAASYDVNTDGVDHYGLYPDWIEDLRIVGGEQIVNDMANGGRGAYVQMWARAEDAAAPYARGLSLGRSRIPRRPRRGEVPRPT